MENAFLSGNESTTGTTQSLQVLPGDSLLFEVEDFRLNNYKIEGLGDFASGGLGIELSSYFREGSASIDFTGPTGTYDVTIGYFDENDGRSRARFEIGGQVVDQWTFDEHLGFYAASASTLSERLIEGVEIESGEELKLLSKWNRGERGRFDYIKIVPTNNTEEPDNEPEPTAPNGFFFTVTRDETLDGIKFTENDVIQFDGTSFSYLFDGSDVGLSSRDFEIQALDVISSDEILLSFDDDVSLPGVGDVDESDVVLFTATSLGENTAGSFSLYFDGSDVGLSSRRENIDALTRLPDGSLLISTTSDLDVFGYSAKDEDVSLFTPNILGERTSGSFSRFIDGSDIGLRHKDVDAFSIDAAGDFYFSTSKSFLVPGLYGRDEDVFGFTPSSTGNATRGDFASELFFNGSRFGISSDIAGIDVSFPEETPDTFESSEGTPEQQSSVAEALNNHAQQIGETFAEDSDWLAFLTDIYGDNIDPDRDLIALRDQFVAGSLRPEVRFVPQAILTDPRGETRPVAFAASRSTLLLSEDLEQAGIEAAILVDLGHWWDVQLSGQDTVAPDGDPFDEGVAYSERFAEGVEGSGVFSDAAFLNDRFTIFLDGESIDVEFAAALPVYSEAAKTYLDSLFLPINGAPALLELESPEENGDPVYATLADANTAIEAVVDENRFVFASVVTQNNDGETFEGYQVGSTDLGLSTHPAWDEEDSDLKNHLKRYAQALIADGNTANNTSEALGEIATAIATVQRYSDAKLLISEGTNAQNIDQIWQNNDDAGVNTLIIAEAKGGGATLSEGSSYLGPEDDAPIIDNQMSPEWVIDRLGRKEEAIGADTERGLIEQYGIFKKLVNTYDRNGAFNNKRLFVLNGFENDAALQPIEGIVIQAQGSVQNPFYTNQTSSITLSDGNTVGAGVEVFDYDEYFGEELLPDPSAEVNIDDALLSGVFQSWQAVPEFNDLIDSITNQGAITIRGTTGVPLNGVPKVVKNDFKPFGQVSAFWDPEKRTVNLDVDTIAPTRGLFQEAQSNLLFELQNANLDAAYEEIFQNAVQQNYADATEFAGAVLAVEGEAAANWAQLAPLLQPFQPPTVSSFKVENTLENLFAGDALNQASIEFYKDWYEENKGNPSATRFVVNKPDTNNLLVEYGLEITVDGGDEELESTFFTFSDIDQGTDVRVLDPGEDIDPNLPTYIVTHGYTDGVNNGEEWQKGIGQKILEEQEANIILVDWDAPGFGIRELFDAAFVAVALGEDDPELAKEEFNQLVMDLVDNYENAARNTEVIGERIAELVVESEINPESTTLIGHSLGAQVSGWAGQKYQNLEDGTKLSSIIGLDPARPGFQEALSDEFFFLNFGNDEIRDAFNNAQLVEDIDDGVIDDVGNYVSSHQLDADDADRVTAIHTSQIFGITEPIRGREGTDNLNTLDLYINGGLALGTLLQVDDHGYAHEYFQSLLEGVGSDQDRNELPGSQPLSDLRNPILSQPNNEITPIVSLNTFLQGNGTAGDVNRGIFDIPNGPTLEIGEGDMSEVTIATYEGTEANDTLTGLSSRLALNEVIYVAKDSITGGEGDDLISGFAGDDTLRGDAGNDSLFGGPGDDEVDGGPGNNTIRGNDGNDIIFVSGGGDNLLFGGIGDDTIAGDEGNDTIRGGEGNDAILAVRGDRNQLFGDAGDDKLTAGGLEGDSLVGGQGNDELVGGQGGDILLGGDGDDTLQAGGGNGSTDDLIGGRGNDSLEGDFDQRTRLTGVSPFDDNPGVGEIDILVGNPLGNEIFVLGNETKSYYLDGDANGGNSYAMIDSFDVDLDQIEINADAIISIGSTDTSNIELLDGSDLIAIITPPPGGGFSAEELVNLEDSLIRV